MRTVDRAALAPAAPLSFDERLALSALRIDLACTSLKETFMEDLLPPAAWAPAATLASVLEDAAGLIRSAGWIRGALASHAGYCMLGALSAAAPSGPLSDDAADLVLRVIRTEFETEATSVAAFNDGETDSTRVLAVLDRAASRARRGLET